MPRHFAAIVPPLALLLALTACSQTEDKLLDLQLSQSVQDRFNQPASVFTAGETVAVVAALRNPNSKAVRVQFGGCQLFRTEIKSAAGEFVTSDPSAAAACTADIKNLVIAAGESTPYRFVWDQRDADGTQVVAGLYDVQTSATYNFEGNLLNKVPVRTQRIEIR